MKRLLILGAGEMQIPVILKAKNMGLYVMVADMDSEAPGMKYADEAFIISTLDKERILQLATEQNINGILTTSDAPVNVVSYVSEVLGLPSMSTETADICTNKYKQRQRFKETGVNTPYFKLCTENSDLNDVNQFPCIVKPVDSSASRGVTKASCFEELTKAFEFAKENSRTGQIIVEGFIEGREFSVETLTQGGITTVITVTEKITIGETEGYFVENTHIQPARISEEEYKLIADEVIKAARAIGLDNCPSHTEIKMNGKGVCIIEMACRLGGDYITSDLVPLSTGVDMLQHLIRLSLGEEIRIDKPLAMCSAVQFLTPANYDKCVNFIDNRHGDTIRYDVKPFSDKTIKSSLDRLGYIIIQTHSMNALEEILKQLN